MKKRLSLLISTTVLLFTTSLMAADKVVVIPLGSTKAKGADGQVQYNDEGKTAGAEIYYDKLTGKLEVPGEVRNVDESGNNRLWGKGRPGTKLMTHTNSDGYCTSDSGIKHALSFHLATWGDADEVCPAGTWVCSNEELPATGSCPIESVVYGTKFLACSGVPTSGALTTASGWVADVSLEPTDDRFGYLRHSENWLGSLTTSMCCSYRSWCCWK